MPEGVTPGQAFLWLIRQASDEEARGIIDQVLGDPNARWSEIVEKKPGRTYQKAGEVRTNLIGSN